MNTKTLIAIGVVLAAGAAVGAYNVFGPTYADVVSAEPITVKEPILANVLSATAIKETVTGTRQVCEDRVVERRAQERFGDKDGMVVGALVGGLLGNQVGGGRGRDVATVAAPLPAATPGERSTATIPAAAATTRPCRTAGR